MLTQIYTGCKCPNGETYNVRTSQCIDTSRDKVETYPYCASCGGTNIRPKKSKGGLDCYHEITGEELDWELFQAGEHEETDWD